MKIYKLLQAYYNTRVYQLLVLPMYLNLVELNISHKYKMQPDLVLSNKSEIEFTRITICWSACWQYMLQYIRQHV